MVRKIIGGMMISIAILVAVVEIPAGNMEPIFPAIIFCIVGLVLLLRRTIPKEEKQRRKEHMAASKEKASRTLSGKHMAGLPLAQGVDCTLVFESDCVAISNGGNSFRLDYQKVTDLQLTTSVELQKNYVSSVGGAVGGAVLFGPLGAMVGGRAKEKTSRVIEYYFIITYHGKTGDLEYLSFETYAPQQARDLIQRFRPLLEEQIGCVEL